MYKVILINQLQAGFVLEEAKRELSERVKLTESQLEKILSFPDYAVLRTEKRDLATRVVSMIHNCGFSAEIISDSEVFTSNQSVHVEKNAGWIGTEWLHRSVSVRSGKIGGVQSLVVLSLLLSALLIALMMTGKPTLDAAADYALESLLVSGQPVAPDLQTKFARADIRICFQEKVRSWDSKHYDLYVESLKRVREMRHQEDQLKVYQAGLERDYPSVAAAIHAALTCPKEFMLN